MSRADLSDKAFSSRGVRGAGARDHEEGVMQDRVLMYAVGLLAALMVVLWLVALWPGGRHRDKDKDRGGRRDRNQDRGGGGS